MIGTYDNAKKVPDSAMFFAINVSILKSMHPAGIQVTREIIFRALRDANVAPILGNAAMFTILMDGLESLKQDHATKLEAKKEETK